MANANDFGLLSPDYSNQGSGSALIKTGYGRLRGVFSSGTGSMKLWDNTEGSGGVIVNTFDLSASTYYDMADVSFGTGLYADIATPADVTFFYF